MCFYLNHKIRVLFRCFLLKKFFFSFQGIKMKKTIKIGVAYEKEVCDHMFFTLYIVYNFDFFLTST